jgi:uncharacterized membrane protein
LKPDVVLLLKIVRVFLLSVGISLGFSYFVYALGYVIIQFLSADRHTTLFLTVSGLLVFLSTAYGIVSPASTMPSARLGKGISMFSALVILTITLFSNAHQLGLEPNASLFMTLKGSLLGGIVLGIYLACFSSNLRKDRL